MVGSINSLCPKDDKTSSFSSSQMSRAELARTMPWRENEGFIQPTIINPFDGGNLYGQHGVVLGDVLFFSLNHSQNAVWRKESPSRLSFLLYLIILVTNCFNSALRSFLFNGMPKSLLADTWPVSINSLTMSHTFSTSSTDVPANENTSMVYSSVLASRLFCSSSWHRLISASRLSR